MNTIKTNKAICKIKYASRDNALIQVKNRVTGLVSHQVYIQGRDQVGVLLWNQVWGQAQLQFVDYFCFNT
jgi:hypothetical protein